MKTMKLNLLSRLFCAFLLVFGLALTSCEDGPLGDGANGGESSVLTWSLDNVTEVSASFTGTLAVPASELSFSKVTVCYSDAEVFNINDAQKISTTTFSSDLKFSITVTGLKPSVKYNYCVIAEVKSEMTYGDVMDFTTLGIVPDTNLSAEAPANSYIISSAGSYKFSTVKGNSSESVGTVASAEVLWESFGTDVTPNVGDLVKCVACSDGYVAFQTADTYKEGNAVIAAKDAAGTILWSWHIWFTDQPEGQVYYNDAGTMMDRNLGATSATPGDVGALGLLYQWGRKDPFLGSSSISDDVEAKSTITWPSAVSSNSSSGTIAYATAHPTTFITYNSNNYDWYYTGSSSTDNTRWTTSDKTKSIYDPCPAGWRVPDGGSNGVWSKTLGSSSYFQDSSLYSSTNEGMNFSGMFGSYQTIWYPVSGYRFCDDGSLNDVGGGGRYWSASPDDSYAYYLSLYDNGLVYPSSHHYRASGDSVRCLQEK